MSAAEMSGRRSLTRCLPCLLARSSEADILQSAAHTKDTVTHEKLCMLQTMSGFQGVRDGMPVRAESVDCYMH